MLNGRKMKDFISYKKKKDKDLIFLRYERYILKELNGMTYNDLPKTLQIRLKRKFI